ncbi:hypothetical protein K449DRAFT_385303 [Hypoxylon sp. EC38]|nr:hypothetical protein K449DRAFT_385303 [Hypoxylon sp. EC38]
MLHTRGSLAFFFTRAESLLCRVERWDEMLCAALVMGRAPHSQQNFPSSFIRPLPRGWLILVACGATTGCAAAGMGLSGPACVAAPGCRGAGVCTPGVVCVTASTYVEGRAWAGSSSCSIVWRMSYGGEVVSVRNHQ